MLLTIASINYKYGKATINQKERNLWIETVPLKRHLTESIFILIRVKYQQIQACEIDDVHGSTWQKLKISFEEVFDTENMGDRLGKTQGGIKV